MNRNFIALFLLALVLASCKTRERVVMVETVRNDTTYITKHQRDSIWLHDSIFIKEQTKDDSVFVLVEKWHTKYIEKQVHDTTYIATHDTIPEPYPVEVQVEKKLSKWQKLRMRAGEAAMGLSGVLIVFGLFKLKRKFF